jgi:hypothetical protein
MSDGSHQSPYDFDQNLDASGLLSAMPADAASKLLGEITVKPQEQLRLTLGTFPVGQIPSGFSVELSPDPDPPNSIVSRITNLEAEQQHELILHIANFGSKTVTAKVWQI